MPTSPLYVVVGLGLSGLSVLRFLHQNNIPVALTDSRVQPNLLAQVETEFPELELKLGCFDEALLNRATTLVLSPGVAPETPIIMEQIRAGKEVISDIELFARFYKAPIIGITGTNAKSTVTTLVYLMLKAAGLNVFAGGNLGPPALDLPPQADAYVLELSSFQLQTTQHLPLKVAAVLNVTPDHLDRHFTLENYAHIKKSIYRQAEHIIFNADDKLTEPDGDVSEKQCAFSIDKCTNTAAFHLQTYLGHRYLCYEQTRLIEVEELLIKGEYYLANALAALAIGHAYGLSFSEMLSVIRTFKGLAHRCEWVRKIRHVDWYNDSKGTNVGATLAAVNGLGRSIKGKLILIAGGVGKGADFSPLAPVLKQYCRCVILIGEAAPIMAKALSSATTIVFASSLAVAVQIADETAIDHDNVLLSPACASLDMFQNFEHRGDCFKELVCVL